MQKVYRVSERDLGDPQASLISSSYNSMNNHSFCLFSGQECQGLCLYLLWLRALKCPEIPNRTALSLILVTLPSPVDTLRLFPFS